ncbi:MAG: hypothetical protein IJL80_04455, partial [Treponema sp.]|nr:hypothetical protein [Treponema sp.]
RKAMLSKPANNHYNTFFRLCNPPGHAPDKFFVPPENDMKAAAFTCKSTRFNVLKHSLYHLKAVSLRSQSGSFTPPLPDKTLVKLPLWVYDRSHDFTHLYRRGFR